MNPPYGRRDRRQIRQLGRTDNSQWESNNGGRIRLSFSGTEAADVIGVGQ